MVAVLPALSDPLLYPFRDPVCLGLARRCDGVRHRTGALAAVGLRWLLWRKPPGHHLASELLKGPYDVASRSVVHREVCGFGPWEVFAEAGHVDRGRAAEPIDR